MALFAGESSALVSTRTSAAEVIARMLREAKETQRRIGAYGAPIVPGAAATHQT